MSTYVGLLQRLLSESAPSWLRNRYGRAFLEAIGLTLDLGTATFQRGLEQTYPLMCESTSLPILGSDRGIRRYPTEPEASYRVRLARWRQIKKHAGSHYGEMISIQPFFLPGALPTIRIVHQSGDGVGATWHTLNPDGSYETHYQSPSNWRFDPSSGEWSRAWLIIYVTGVGLDGAQYDDGIAQYDDGVTLWDGHLSSEQIDDIASIYNDSKAAHSVLKGIILASDPASFDPAGSSVSLPDGSTTFPVGNWRYAIDPVTGLPTRLGTASYTLY